jgi:hypothetical protein
MYRDWQAWSVTQKPALGLPQHNSQELGPEQVRPGGQSADDIVAKACFLTKPAPFPWAFGGGCSSAHWMGTVAGLIWFFMLCVLGFLVGPFPVDRQAYRGGCPAVRNERLFIHTLSWATVEKGASVSLPRHRSARVENSPFDSPPPTTSHIGRGYRSLLYLFSTNSETGTCFQPGVDPSISPTSPCLALPCPALACNFLSESGTPTDMHGMAHCAASYVLLSECRVRGPGNSSQCATIVSHT